MRPAPTPAPTAGNDHGRPREQGTGEALPENPMAGSGPGQGAVVPFASTGNPPWGSRSPGGPWSISAAPDSALPGFVSPGQR